MKSGYAMGPEQGCWSSLLLKPLLLLVVGDSS